MDHSAYDVALRLGAVLLLVFANGFFVAAEFALVTVRKTRDRSADRRGQPAAPARSAGRSATRTATSPPRSSASRWPASALGWIGEPAIAAAARAAVRFAARRRGPRPARTRIAVAIAFAMHHRAPHRASASWRRRPSRCSTPRATALFVAGPTELFMVTFWPFITPAERHGPARPSACSGLEPPSGHSMVHSEEELKMLVTASQEAGVLEEDEEQMLHRVFGFGDLTAGQVMVPRTEMTRHRAPTRRSTQVIDHRVAAAAPLAARLPRRPRRHRRRSSTSTDLFPALRTPAGRVRPSAAHLREALTVPETMKADDLLERDAAAPHAPRGRHRRVRRDRGAGHVRRADGADRRRGGRRVQPAGHAHLGAARRLGAHRRAGADDRRERAVRPAHRRATSTPRSAGSCWAGWAGARGWATAWRWRAGRCASRRSTACASRACHLSAPTKVEGVGPRSAPQRSDSVRPLRGSQQPQAVGDHEQRRAHVGDDRHPERGDARPRPSARNSRLQAERQRRC